MKSRWQIMLFLISIAVRVNGLELSFSNSELSKARASVGELMAFDLKDYKENKIGCNEVARKSLLLSDRADLSICEKYLLLRGAYKFYCQDGDKFGAEATLRKMNDDYHFPPNELLELIDEVHQNWLCGSYEFPEIKLRSAFGIDSESLSNTNRFPISPKCKLVTFGLKHPLWGFDVATMFFTNDSRHWESVELERRFPNDVSEWELRSEYESVVNGICKTLGITLKNPTHQIKLRSCIYPDDAIEGLENPYIKLTLELGDGCCIDASIRDARYIKRNGVYLRVKAASIVVCIRHVDTKCYKNAVCGNREIDFGCDCTDTIAEAVSDTVGESPFYARENREIKRLKLQASKGDVRAMKALIFRCERGLGIKYDPGLIFKYSKMAADAGDASGLYELSKCYTKGIGVIKDPRMAAELLARSAVGGDEVALIAYAERLEKGEGTQKNLTEAFRWYKKSADDGNSWAVLKLVECYLKGKGVEKNVAMAKECLVDLERLADNGDNAATMFLADFYVNGIESECKNPMKAFKYCERASKTWGAYGVKRLVKFYVEGIGTARNLEKARQCLNDAILRYSGDPRVKKDLQMTLDQLPTR